MEKGKCSTLCVLWTTYTYFVYWQHLRATGQRGLAVSGLRSQRSAWQTIPSIK